MNWVTHAVRRDQRLAFNGHLVSVEVGSDCYLRTYSVSLTCSGGLMGYENLYEYIFLPMRATWAGHETE